MTGKVQGSDIFEINIPNYITDKIRTDWYTITNTVMNQEDLELAGEYLTMQALVECIQRYRNMGFTVTEIKVSPRLIALAEANGIDLYKML